MKKLAIFLGLFVIVLLLNTCTKDKSQDYQYHQGDYPTTPNAGFEMSTSGNVAPCEVSFNPVERSGVTYEWRFGDGGTSDAQMPIHTYTRQGIYSPLLTVFKNQYPQDASARAIEIKGPLFEKIGSDQVGKTVKSVAESIRILKDYYADYSDPFSTNLTEIRSEYSDSYFVGGYTAIGDLSTRNRYCSRLNMFGKPIWEKIYSYPGEDAFNAVTARKDKLYAAGYVQNISTGKYDASLMCLDTQGHVLWQKPFVGATSQVFNSITYCQTAQSYYPDDAFSDLMLTGYVIGANGDKDVLIMRISELGDLVWQKTVGGLSDEEGLSICMKWGYPYSSNKLYITGYKESAMEKKDVLLVVADYETGKISTVNSFGGAKDDIGNSIIIGSGSGCLITGRTESLGGGKADVYLAETDQIGNLVFSTTFGGSDAEEGCSIFRHKSDGSYVISGNRFYTNGQVQPLMIKLAAYSKVKILEKNYPSSFSNRIYAGIPTIDNGVFMGGVSGPVPQVYLLRTDKNGDY